jgi:LPS export ABC transporter protein LptC
MLNVQDTGIYVEFPKTLHADFYNPSGMVESKLDALYAKYRRNESIVYIRDSVKVVNLLKGDTLYCDELYWDRSRVGNEFYTNKPVRIRTRTQIINGVGMEASQDFRQWHIIRSTGTIQLPASKFPG